MKSTIYYIIITAFISFLSLNRAFSQDSDHQWPITIVIHGGAGTITRANMSRETEDEYRNVLSEALNIGYEALASGRTALDAITSAILVMEDSPLFNAGKGAVFTNEGINELDASIMDGKSTNAGAVAGVTNIKNPILAARAVMEKSPHVLLTGKGAEMFSKENDLEIVDAEYFYTERRYKSLQKIKQMEKEEGRQNSDVNFKFGTVGALALDQYGNLAAGTSTGGMTNKKFGRVGDSPIIGAGTYADNETCAVSSTGHGEYFIRNVVAYDIAARMKYLNEPLKKAAQEVVMNTLKKDGGSGGIIALDRDGNIAMTFNTEGMYRGYRTQGGAVNVYIFKENP